MSHAHRPSLIHPTTTSSTSTSTSNTLTNRITQKRAELENLRALRDLSADLASQMAVLESKLDMLQGGTEGVAEVLRNWRGVLGVLGLVGGEMRGLVGKGGGEGGVDGKGQGDGERFGDGEDEGEESGMGGVRGKKMDLPGTLVRIPVDAGVGVSGIASGEATNGKGKKAG